MTFYRQPPLIARRGLDLLVQFVIALSVALCIAAVAVGANPAISAVVAPETETCPEESETETEFSSVLQFRPRPRVCLKSCGVAQAPIWPSLSGTLAGKVRLIPPPLPVPSHLIGSGIRLRC